MSRYIQRWPENDLHEHHSTIVLPLLYKLSKLYPLHTLRKLGIDNNFKSITRKPEEIKQWPRDTNVFWKKKTLSKPGSTQQTNLKNIQLLLLPLEYGATTQNSTEKKHTL